MATMARGLMTPNFEGGPVSIDDPSLATESPNPSLDTSSDGSDGGASNVADTVNSLGQWGATITGILLNRPVATQQGTVKVGPPPASVKQAASQSNAAVILLVVLGGLLLFAAVSK